ncbi:hypothetical protein ACGFNU_34310 [Spirillospora sp. NPDC048911]|uniref:hypothetical protein n=1 Tax=Spirillospora sp. NPDC048911 TaxID=3364527 RepID=UPI00371FE303
MNGFLAEVGKKLAERWLALLALPGLLYLATAAVAITLGHGHALDAARLGDRITAWSASGPLRSVGGAALIMLAALLASVAAGLLASGLAVLIELAWTTPGRRRPARWLTDLRRHRSRTAKARADNATTQIALVRAIAAADRICLLEADRPTWLADRLRVTRLRMAAAYDLDLDTAWPRLWLLIPIETRQELAAARDALGSLFRLSAWSLLYLPLAIWWWPAIPIAAALHGTAVLRVRPAATNLADLVEATVDLHIIELSERLSVQLPDLTTRLSKSRWDPRSKLAD